MFSSNILKGIYETYENRDFYPTAVKSTSRMKFMTKTRVQVIDRQRFNVHLIVAGSAKSIFAMVDREGKSAPFGAARRNAQGRWEGFR